jgi:hypothetical protein
MSRKMSKTHVVTLTFSCKEAKDNWVGWYLDGNGEQDFFAATDEHHPLDIPEDEEYDIKHDDLREARAGKWYPKVDHKAVGL